MVETADVLFTPSGRRGRVPLGTTVLEAARSLNVDLDSVCGARGICGRCQVEIGERPGVPADVDRLTPPDGKETSYSGRRPLTDGRRMGCAARVRRDVVIRVPAESQVHRQVVRKVVGRPTVPVDPLVQLRYVELPEPTLADTVGELQRLRTALAEQWDLAGISVELTALAALQPALDAGHRAVTVAVRDGQRVVAVWPGLSDSLHGVAFDVGSTTLAGHLCDLGTGAVLATSGRMNPQMGYGEDLMSRVSYVLMNPEGAARLTATVREALAAMVAEMCREADVDPGSVLEVTFVGNPVMHHLVLGLDSRHLGTAPFVLATTEAVSTSARELGLDVHPGARAYTPPCVAGHVGADAAAMVLAEAPHRSQALTLLVDVGTNAEIVLGNDRRLLAASSPTGPAFEGAQISGGQRAAPGAVERVRIDRETLEPRVKVVGCDLWSDDDGFARAVRRTGVTGICGSGILEAIAELFLAGVVTADGRLVRPGGTSSPRIVESGRTLAYRLWADPVLEVTQSDVRAIQLAKAALQAGCRLLMERFGVTTVDRIRLAGAFGSHLDPMYAMVLGLLPDCELDDVGAAGNSAGTGALMVLLSSAARTEIEQVTARIDKVETAIEPDFQEHFVAAMAFPHASLPYSHLAERVLLPAPPAAGGPRRSRRSVR